MEKSHNKEYTLSAFWLVLVVTALLVMASFMPSFSIGELNIKQRSIVSEIYANHGQDQFFNSVLSYDSTALLASAQIEIPQITDSLFSRLDLKSTSWTTSSYDFWDKQIYVNNQRPSTVREDEYQLLSEIKIEDFGRKGASEMDKFYQVLARRGELGRPVRIAVLGDSFIEGDILTADIRELLQKRYGGTGVGFVPFASPIAKFRGTVSHTFSGLTLHNLAQSSTVTTSIKDKFSISGLLATAEQDAEIKFKGVSFRDNLKHFPKAKLLFINEKNTVISVVVNDSLHKVFRPESNPNVQEININSSIEHLTIRITDPKGFIGYGVEMEGPEGVTVDNYSIRGSSGLSLFKTNPDINRQLNQLLGYDLVILQYGLNMMSPSMSNYTTYSNQMTRIIHYIRECFPGAAVLLMSVGDRSQNVGGAMTSMSVIHAMIAAQRQAAKISGAAFWNTFEAMGGKNSMVTFVRNNWAAKDYTHMRYQGGRVIANRFVESLIEGQNNYLARMEPKFDIPRYGPLLMGNINPVIPVLYPKID